MCRSRAGRRWVPPYSFGVPLYAFGVLPSSFLVLLDPMRACWGRNI
jgi:hypothetical protein